MSTALTTTHQDPLTAIELAGHLADSTKAQYTKALQGYLDTGNGLTDAHALAEYARTLSKSRRAFLKSALRLWSKGARQAFREQATPDNVSQVQAALYRLEALENAIEAPKQKGTKTHTWLSQAEVRKLLETCDIRYLPGQRDRLLLGLLVAAGLRRGEAANLRFEDVKLQPVKEKFRTVLDIEGKGAKARVVPISDSLANAIDQWSKVVGGKGHVLRALGMNREPGESMTAVAIFNVVRKRGEMMGKDDLAPHDLRRTYAQIGYEAGVPITQLSKLLGHASVATTQKYLNLDLDLETTASDFVPF
jgi:integrase